MIRHTVEVICDRCCRSFSCTSKVPDDKEAYAHAKRQGWMLTQDKHYCNECKPVVQTVRGAYADAEWGSG